MQAIVLPGGISSAGQISSDARKCGTRKLVASSNDVGWQGNSSLATHVGRLTKQSVAVRRHLDIDREWRSAIDVLAILRASICRHLLHAWRRWRAGHCGRAWIMSHTWRGQVRLSRQVCGRRRRSFFSGLGRRWSPFSAGDLVKYVLVIGGRNSHGWRIRGHLLHANSIALEFW